VALEVDVRERVEQILDPRSGRFDPVRLRSSRMRDVQTAPGGVQAVQPSQIYS